MKDILPQAEVYVGFQQFIDYDIELENAALGICLIEPRAYSKIHGILTEDCFFTKANKTVFKAIEDVWKQGDLIDLLTVNRLLYDKKITELNMISTAYYTMKLTVDVVSSAHLLQWSLKLRELAARRLMIQLTSTRFKGDDVLDGADDIQVKLQKALHVRHAADWQDTSVAAVALTNHIDELMNNDVVGVTTGFPTLDDINGGFRAGQLIVIGARPSVGKSALMGKMAINAAQGGYKVGVISLEMPAKDIFGRLVSRETGVPFAEIDRHGLDDPSKIQAITQSINNMATLPIYFCDATQVTIHDIRAKAEQLQQRFGLNMLMIDYLQLVEETDKYRSREQGVAQISRGLKMLAMNLEIPVIALSQLNRESEHRANKRPTMADLRESGAIEQDADIVMLLHRDWQSGITHDSLGNSTENQADLLIYKWRNGSPQNLKLHFQPDTMSFSEAA